MNQQVSKKTPTDWQTKKGTVPTKSAPVFHLYQHPMFENHSAHRDSSNFMQPKFFIGSLNDKYEREADDVADMVLKKPNHNNLQQVHRPKAALLQRHTESSAVNQSNDISESVRAVISSGRGRPLDKTTREFMESRFEGRDFGNVRIYTDDLANESAKSMDANAYTVGSNIVFGAGKYEPGTNFGNNLLAHELAHIVQQSNGRLALQRKASKHRAGGRERIAEPKTKIKWEEAHLVLTAIIDIINSFVEVKEGRAYRKDFPAAHRDVPAKWQPLLHEWWMIANGTIEYPDGIKVSYLGDFLAQHIDMAVAKTEPLVEVIVAEGTEEASAQLAEYYTSRVNEFRARAVREAVSAAIGKSGEKGIGGALDVEALVSVENLKIASSQALKTVSAVMTVAVRTAGANVNQLKEIDKLYAQAMGKVEVSQSLQTTRAMNLQAALLHIQGGLRLVQAIINVADPEKRREIYEKQGERFGPVAGYSEILKNLGMFVSGATAVAGAGTYAVAKVLGKAELAAKALRVGSNTLGKMNVALNALGVIHGIAVLVNEEATTEEKVEAGVEVASGGLGLVGRFVPALSWGTAAVSASLLINFYAFKGILSEGMQAVGALIALGLNICYDNMARQASIISETAMRYAAALDLAKVITDPVKATELTTQIDSLRFNLVELCIREFMLSATRTHGAGNKDPGGYEILRRRFLPLKGYKLETDAQIIAFTKRLLDTIVLCFVDAKEIYIEQVKYRLEHRY